MNTLDATGLNIESLETIVINLQEGLRTIYGPDIILDSNTPDAQWIMIMAQLKRDLLEVLQQMYNSFDPSLAIGTQLDARCAINNIVRRGATYTQQQIQITVNRSVTLQGLDANANDPDGIGYTVADNAGNQFILLSTVSLAPGTHLLTFRAKQLGAITTLPNTITNPVTVVLGVTAINNASGVLELGQNEESDAQLRIRREKSVAISSNGYLNGLDGALADLDGVTDTRLYENIGPAVDANGIPGHGIWCIVEGGVDSEIANTIYAKKSYGADMKGSVTYNIITPSTQVFVAKFDRPIAKNLYIRFDLKTVVPGFSFNLTAIKQGIVDGLIYNIGDNAETSSITMVIINVLAANGGGGVGLNIEISKDNISYFDFLSVDLLNEKWIVDTTRIFITQIL
jgi:uncharacterized phage protein gp47/JayE